MAVLVVLNRINDESIKRNTFEPKPIVIPKYPIVNQPEE